jgi:hypothetical protein
MDEYGQIGPEKGDFAVDCAEVAHHLMTQAAPLYVTLTHRLTRMEVLLTMKRDWDRPAGGGEPQGVRQEVPSAPWLLVTVIERGACWAQLGKGWTPVGGYIDSHMTREGTFNEVDAETVAEFLREVGEAYSRLLVAA